MAMIYLVSLGHPINAAPAGGKESATVIVSELTGRSERSLQDDYYRHRDSLSKDRFVLVRGELELKALKNIAAFKSEREAR